jgi:tRNA G26 N,N-dimethylase Trm1
MLKEGKANILYVEQKLEKDDDGYIKAAKSRKRIANEINETRGSVFYNPVQEFNRDISITVIREFIKIQREELDAKGKDHNKDGVYILEALAATGLRSVRYCKEIDNIKKIYSNDLDPKAVELMKKNFEFNDIDQTKYEGKFSQFDLTHFLFSFNDGCNYFDALV